MTRNAFGRIKYLVLILVAFETLMLKMGASMYEVIVASTMIFAMHFAGPLTEQLVFRWTGRTSESPSGDYKSVNLLLILLIGLPPIYFLPGAHYLVLISFQFIGLLVGGIVAQAVFGRKSTLNDAQELRQDH